MGAKACRAGLEGRVRLLTKHEIDRRIELLVEEVAMLDAGDGHPGADAFRPRWITAAELVRRMRPFVGLN
jgi:hypothetical protein